METWEYAEIIWDGDEKGDYREVRFTNQAREWFKPAGNQYLDTLRWLGEMGFEMVSSQYFAQSSKGGGWGGHDSYFSNRQKIFFKRRVVEQAPPSSIEGHATGGVRGVSRDVSSEFTRLKIRYASVGVASGNRDWLIREARHNHLSALEDWARTATEEEVQRALAYGMTASET